MSTQQAPTQGYGRLEGWLATFDSYGVRFLVLDKHKDRSLLDIVRERPGWSVDFEDTESVLFTRRRALECPNRGLA